MGRGKGSPPLEPAWNRLARDRTIPTLSPLFPWKMGSRDRISFIFRLRLVTRGLVKRYFETCVSCFDRRIGFEARQYYGSLHILNGGEWFWRERREVD